MSSHASIRDIVIGLIFRGEHPEARASRPDIDQEPRFGARGAAKSRTSPGSIALRLFLVFLFLLLLVILLGALAIASLSYSNAASSQVRDRWLPSTRVLGDLNNYTSDHRVAEASLLLAADVQDLAANERQLDELDRNIQASEAIYSKIPSDGLQQQLNRQFQTQWRVYREFAQQVRSLVVAEDLAAARTLYNTTSRAAYDKASHTFDLLDQSNVDSARRASLRSASAYHQAQWVVALTIFLAGAAVAAATVEPPPEVVKKKPKAPKKSQSKEEKEAAKEKRLLKLVGAVVVKCMSKYSGKMDTDVFKKYAKEVRTSLAFLLLSLAIFLTLLHS